MRTTLQLIIDLPPDQYRVIEPGPPLLARLLAWLVSVAAAILGLVTRAVRAIEAAYLPTWLAGFILAQLTREAVRSLVDAFETAGLWLAGKTLDYTLKGVVTC